MSDNTPSVVSMTKKTRDQLKSFVERIERLNEEKKELDAGIKEVKDEAKSAGFDVKAITKLIGFRRASEDLLAAEFAVIDTYGKALGMQLELPLLERAEGKDEKAAA